MKFLIATRSPGKIREIEALLGTHPTRTYTTLAELGIEPSPAEDEIESFESFRENAMAKALYFAGLTGLPTIADDSGIAVAALGGAPGVRSKRFALEQTPPGAHVGDAVDTRLAGDALDQANNALLLQRLRGVPDEQRGAHYACAVALALPNRPLLTTIGTVSGRIASEPRGTGGFGYDPIFLLPDLGLTFGEVSAEEKNRRSHRARAFNALRAILSSGPITP